MSGDYISREAVLAQKGDCYDKDGHLLYAVGTGNILRIPAADVRPVAKAEWVWMSSTYDRTPCEMRYECSACHHETISHGHEPWEKFCPNCGAKMDGGQDE